MVAEDVPLGGEVREEGVLADVGRLGDVGDRDPVEAPLGEQPHRLGEDALAGPCPPSCHPLAHGRSVHPNMTMVKI